MIKDTVEINRHNTGVKITPESSGIGDFSALFPDYVAVRHDATARSRHFMKQQRTSMIRWAFIRAGITLALCIGTLLLFMAQNNDYQLNNYLNPWVWFIAVVTLLVTFGLGSGSIDTDAQDLDIYATTLALLTEKYTQQVKQHSQEKEAQLRHKAQSLLNNRK